MNALVDNVNINKRTSNCAPSAILASRGAKLLTGKLWPFSGACSPWEMRAPRTKLWENANRPYRLLSWWRDNHAFPVPVIGGTMGRVSADCE